MAASAILDLSGVHWDHPRRLLGDLYRRDKFGWNHCSTFDNMKVLIFCAFGLKTPIHVPEIGFLGDFTPLVGSNINVTPKGTNGCEITSFKPLSVKIAPKL